MTPNEQLGLDLPSEMPTPTEWRDDPAPRPRRPPARGEFAPAARVARSSDPDTSRETPVLNLTAKRRAVLEAMNHYVECADMQLVDWYAADTRCGTRWPVQSPSGIRTRRSELVAVGYVRNSGGHVIDGGRRHIRWRITDAGREALA